MPDEKTPTGDATKAEAKAAKEAKDETSELAGPPGGAPPEPDAELEPAKAEEPPGKVGVEVEVELSGEGKERVGETFVGLYASDIVAVEDCDSFEAEAVATGISQLKVRSSKLPAGKSAVKVFVKD